MDHACFVTVTKQGCWDVSAKLAVCRRLWRLSGCDKSFSARLLSIFDLDRAEMEILHPETTGNLRVGANCGARSSARARMRPVETRARRGRAARDPPDVAEPRAASTQSPIMPVM